MPQTTAEFYSGWLERTRSAPILQEDQTPPERWMQHLWRHQRLRREALQTTDGRPLAVLHPGFWNRSAGPDFKGAILQLGDGPCCHGDIEIDVHPGGWTQHRHAGNPAYRKVILHVVWQEAANPVRLPVLAMRPQLDAPLSELIPWLLGEAPGLIPANVRGGCAGPLRRLDAPSMEALLDQAARHRLSRKASEIGARARHVGWIQALWEGLLGGLGYRHNTWPLRRIAELIPLASGNPPEEIEALQARLFGLAGFLPADLNQLTPPYVRRLWDHWWHCQDEYAHRVLPGESWQLGGLRPANHPQRRLALAGHWIARPDLANRIVRAVLENPVEDAPDAMAEVLRPGVDPFWDGHWTLAGRSGSPSPLLGPARVTDLAVNVVLPWLWSRARLATGQEAVDRVEARYFGWPAGEDNAVLRTARERLMGPERRRLPRRAAIQQGLLQVSDDFCSATDSLCGGCGFPALVEGWRDGQKKEPGGMPGSMRNGL